MGQKVNPIGLRLKINKMWDSRWYAGKNYAALLIEDIKIRSYVMKAFPQAAVAKVVIERPAKKAIIAIHAGRPGVIIGKKGADIEKLRRELMKMTNNQDVSINIVEVRKPELDATIVAQSIAHQIENRASYRRVMKKAMSSTLRMGAEGVRVLVSGRLAGAEIARDEEYMEGRVPLHTLRADIDYSYAEAFTTYGVVGVKVWISRGEVFGPHDKSMENLQSVSAPSA
jgi:small subunit ribosomal protein S3